MSLFRTLTAEEIDVRIGSVSEKGVTLLLYKDARCDMNILDETQTQFGWQRKHYECKGNLFCSVGIKQGDDWIWKDDAGAESKAEKEKGEASDSFKRACTNWGIGRELYTAPFIWINAQDCTIKDKKCFDKFVVDSIEYQNGKINKLIISISKYGKKTQVYAYGGNESQIPKDELKPFPCSVCGKYVPATMAMKSYDKYKKVYCSGNCKEKDI